VAPETLATADFESSVLERLRRASKQWMEIQEFGRDRYFVFIYFIQYLYMLYVTNDVYSEETIHTTNTI
jgi:hypothetical protein